MQKRHGNGLLTTPVGGDYTNRTDVPPIPLDSHEPILLSVFIGVTVT